MIVKNNTKRGCWNIMVFNSVKYLFFLPIVILVYFIIPKKIKYIWLLIVSYYFYMCWNAKYAVLIFFSTITTYLCGILIEILKKKELEYKRKVLLSKSFVAICLLLNIGILFYFKYTSFFFRNLYIFLSKMNINISMPAFDIILPVGISFYTFQAIGYIIDVYRNEINAEKNVFKYALFVSFFPQLVAGPIERSKNLLFQFREYTKFDIMKAKTGLMTIAYGLFLKMVIADNISSVIDPLFSNPDNYTGIMLLMAVILFAFQIYCDFNGYTKIAIGSACILGYKLNENFDSPYFALSIKDFWRRWHISLTSWFRDYVYIPLGGSRKGKIRKQINTMIIFLLSGLWHGAAWHFIAWGGVNGLFSVIEDVFFKYWHLFLERLKINYESKIYKMFQRIITFMLVDFTWLFFRANSFTSAVHICKKIIKGFKLESFLDFGFLNMFTSTSTMIIIFISILIMIVIDRLKYQGKDIMLLIFNQQLFWRWCIYWIILLLVIYWGAYGMEYEQTQFIYFQF